MKQYVQIINQTRSLPFKLQALYCESFACRLRGLTFRRTLGTSAGLLLVQARETRADAGIHMFFVFMDLGIVWINTQGTVVDVKLARAWRSLYIPKQPARFVLEVAPQHLAAFQVGDRLKFENTDLD